MGKTGPQVTVQKKSGASALAQRLVGLGKLAAYVGVPASNSRSQQLLAMTAKTTGKKRKEKLAKAAKQNVSNAELLFIHTKGSPARHIPARPVLEPAVQADGNRQAIASELAQAVQAKLEGNQVQAVARTKRAGLAGQNAARKWFTDSRNGWKKNAPSTIARKGSDRPLIDTGALRVSITYVVKEE